MGYLFLALALICGSTKGYCGKKTSDCVKELPHIALMNIIRMALCIVIGFVFVFFSEGISGLQIDSQQFLICLISGLSTSFFVITWILCVRQSAYTMLDVFLVLSTCIPILLCFSLWQENISLSQIIGFVLLLIAVIFMCLYNNKIKVKLNIKSFLLLILCGVFYGISLFTQKWRNFVCKDTLSAYTFNFYTYVFSCVILVAMFFLTRIGQKNTKENGEKFEFKKIFLYILVMSLCLFLNSLFSTLASEQLDSAIIYPMQQGCSLILSMLMSHFFFGEKIKAYSILGVSLSILAFVVMNLHF